MQIRRDKIRRRSPEDGKVRTLKDLEGDLDELEEKIILCYNGQNIRRSAAGTINERGYL